MHAQGQPARSRRAPGALGAVSQMTMTLIFVPQPLQPLISGQQLSTYVLHAYPATKVDDPALRDLALAMDEYHGARTEYEARNAHYGEWIQWLNQNPTGKDSLVSFATDHQTWLGTAKMALEKINAAVRLNKPLSADQGLRRAIREALAQMDAEAHRLEQNLIAIRSAEEPGGAEDKPSSRIPPQKRPRADTARGAP